MEHVDKVISSRAPANPRRYRDLSYLASTLRYVMKRSLSGLYRSIYDSLCRTGLTLVQFSVPSIAHDNPGLSQSDMADALGHEHPRLASITNALDKTGLAERRENPNDRRERMIYLTPARRSCIKTLKKNFETHQVQLNDRMGSQNFETLMQSFVWIHRHQAK